MSQPTNRMRRAFRRPAALAAAAMLLLSAGCAANAPESAREETEELRVVAGTVAAAQYLNALNVDVAGVPTTDKELPEAYQGKPEVGMPMSPNLEQVLACEPDIFVADSSLKNTLEEMFYGQGVELVLLDNSSYDAVSENIDTLAQRLGKTGRADEVKKEIEQKKQSALALAQGKQQPTVAVIFGTTATFMLATDLSAVGSMVDMLGAVNVTDGEDLTESYVTFDRERLAELNPDVILRLSHADPEETAKAFESEFSKPFWQEIGAVRNGRVYDLDTVHFGVTANLDTVDAPVLLAEMLYGA